MLSSLHVAVQRGIITQEQVDAILALERELGTAPDVVPAPEPAEARRGLNAVTIAYWTGAVAVLFAFGWFIIDRWRVLGAAGLLAVSIVYAGLFAWTAHYLMRRGFRTAASLT